MRPRSWEIDVALYHAAAGLLANGSAALAALSMNLLRAAGAPPNETARALGPLLRSVGDNVERLGMPAALSGPVRRGDVETVERHLAAIARVSEEALDVYRAIGVAQVALSRALGEASPRDLERLSRLFARSSRTLTSAPAGGARGPLKTAEGPPTKTKARA